MTGRVWIWRVDAGMTEVREKAWPEPLGISSDCYSGHEPIHSFSFLCERETSSDLRAKFSSDVVIVRRKLL